MKATYYNLRDWLFQNGAFHLPRIIVVFDTETTGFASAQKSFEDPTQARMCQLGVAVVDTQLRKIINTMDVIVEVPQVPGPVADIHGITTEMSHDFGMSESIASVAFLDLVREHPIVAFNVDFDARIMNCVFARAGMLESSPFIDGQTQNDLVCAMKGVKEYAKVPVTDKQRAKGFTGYKDPNLQEAYKALVDPKGFENAHSAMADVEATMAVLFAAIDMIEADLWEPVNE
ncbi:MAG: rep helicase/DNA complex [Siphoviridae sp. ct7UA22]|nr:MAG: rep helicase/DNA complex [Siphoviridae sp. ct7UA22]